MGDRRAMAMSPPQKDLAIVLRSVAYGDRDRIVTALTEHHGLLSGGAKNAVQSRRFGGALDLFCASEWVFHEKRSSDLVQIVEAQPRKEFTALSRNLIALGVASLWNEIVLRLSPEGERVTELFKIHSHGLVALEEAIAQTAADAKCFAILNAYILKVLRWSGHEPKLEKCLRCERTAMNLEEGASVFISVEEAGWECGRCASLSGTLHREELGLELFSELLVYAALPLRKIAESTHLSEGGLKRLYQVLEALLIFHVPGFDRSPFRSLKLLGLESNLQPRQNL